MKSLELFFITLMLVLFANETQAITFAYMKGDTLYQVLKGASVKVDSGVTDFRVGDEIVAYRKSGELYVNNDGDGSSSYTKVAANVDDYQVAHTGVAFMIGDSLFFHDARPSGVVIKISDNVSSYRLDH